MLRIMARTDVLYLEDPCSGSRPIVHYLAGEGKPIRRDRARNLMRRIGLRSICQRPRTTVAGQPSERYPCLLDITYIPPQKGFRYLVAVVDLFSRHVFSWKLATNLDTQFYMDALEMALSGGRKPEIFCSDQGRQFTSDDFVSRLRRVEIKISCSEMRRFYKTPC